MMVKTYTTLTLAKALDITHQKVREKAEKLGIRVNDFPENEFDLTPDELALLLNSYLKSKLTSDKKERVNSMLNGLEFTPVLPFNDLPKPKKIRVKRSPAGVKMNGKTGVGEAAPNLTERLPQIGKTVFSWVGSLIVLFAFYLFLILVEAYFQAELIHLKTGMSLPLWFGFMFCMLFGLVLFSVNGKYSSHETEFVLLFFFYNFAMSELRFFHDFDGELLSFDTATLALIGFIVPLFILKVGMVVNERVKEMQSV